MELLIAVLLGAVFGGVQMYLLLLATRSVAAGKIKVWAFAAQFFSPIAGLLLCAFLARGKLLVCACVICGILIVGAVAGFVRMRRSKSISGKKDESS